MKHYVTGFLFSADGSKVALIKKINPLWQRGHLNGVGGKIESNEDSVTAMSREFKEETGVLIAENQWHHFVTIQRPLHYHLDVYRAFSDDIFHCKTIEEEAILIIDVKDFPHALSAPIIPNLAWLIPMALDKELIAQPAICLIERSTPRTKA